jgi:protein TonB
MPRDLFGNVTRPSISIGNRKWYTVPLSLLSHSAIVAILVALPILAPAIMPSVFADDDEEWIRILPPPPPPPAPTIDRPRPAVDPNLAPVVAPSSIAVEDPNPPDFTDKPVVGVIDGVENIDRILEPPPAAPIPKPAPPTPVRVGFGVRAPVKTHNVDPIYPPIAQAARVQGVVIIEATISEQGRVINARILRSLPLLDQSALDAVKQWEFTPSQLHGVPVPVIMTVTVNFTLSR